MKGANVIKKVLIVIVVLVVVFAVFMKFFADRTIKTAVETVATKTLNVGVAIASLNLSILRGDMSIGTLMVDNPPGYQNRTLAEVGKLYVSIDIGTLLKDTIIIKQIKLDDVSLTIEQKGLGNNLKDILDSLPSSSAAGEKKPAAEKGGKNLQISELDITGIKVRVKLLPLPGKSDTIELSLPPIQMRDIGKEGEKVDIAVLTEKIITAISKSIAENGGNILPKDLVGSISSGLQNLPGEGGRVILEGGKNVGEGVIEAGKGIGEGVKGLFEGITKPKKDE